MAGEVDVVVVAYNSRDLIGDCLQSIPGDGLIRSITVVDNGTDGTAEIAESSGARILRLPHNPGFGAAQNAGAATGDGALLLLLNPDATLAPGALQRGLSALASDPSIAAVQGVIRDLDGAVERSSGLMLRPGHLLGRALALRRLLRSRPIAAVARRTPIGADHVLRAPKRPTSVEWLAATALLVRRSAFEEVGGFDEAFFLYAEDDDLCRRLRLAGWTLQALPDEWARHSNGASSAGMWERELVYWQGALLLSKRWFGPGGRSVAFASAAVRAAALIARRPRDRKQVVTTMFHSRPSLQG